MDCEAYDDGGAVDIGSGCTFIMNGGLIRDCSAAGNGGAVNIYQDGRFTMTGGTIKNCKLYGGGIGNAVYGSNDEAVVTMTGGTFEDCGVFPYSFDEFTVTFDSDGGSAVSEQKLRNAPAVKPTDPKKSGYNFAGWYLGEEEYTFTAIVAEGITLKAHWTPTAKPTEGDKSDTTTPTGGKDTTSPQTGDNSKMLLWAALLFVSGAGVIGTTIYSKRKRVR